MQKLVSLHFNSHFDVFVRQYIQIDWCGSAVLVSCTFQNLNALLTRLEFGATKVAQYDLSVKVVEVSEFDRCILTWHVESQYYEILVNICRCDNLHFIVIVGSVEKVLRHYVDWILALHRLLSNCLWTFVFVDFYNLCLNWRKWCFLIKLLY